MDLYYKQRTFAWDRKFHIADEQGHFLFKVKANKETSDKKLFLCDLHDQVLYTIRTEGFLFLKKFEILQGDDLVAEVKKTNTGYHVSNLGWDIEGDFRHFIYTIKSHHGHTVATVAPRSLGWGETHKIHVERESQAAEVLCTALLVGAQEMH